MNVATDWIEAKAAQAIAPGRVESALTALQEQWPADAPDLQGVIEQFPLAEAALLHLLSVSSICAARLTREPQLLLWLSDPDTCEQRRGRRRMLADLRGASNNISADNFRALRLWKGREMLRIALREVAEAASLEETTFELSQLAEICVSEVLQHWDRELRNRFGAPGTPFSVLGFGKLGGRELNHSSDIDVLFFYGDEGQVSATLSHHQWFNRLAAKISETFAFAGPSGTLFRMDSRLRPEGSAGPLARSLESLENYYSGFGETWERLALIKARHVAGDAELSYEFLRQHQPFIYPKSPTPELLDEIAAIKRRIERDIVGHENLERNVKLGTGGIREIEFVVQALQLLHGARHAFLQETSTLKALPALASLELLPHAEALALDRAYRFLRRVEHRLQIEAEQQTHTVPDDPEALALLSRSLGFAAPGDFSAALRQHTDRVRAIFQRIIGEQPQEIATSIPPLGQVFRDEPAATKALAELSQGRGSFHVAPRTRQVFRKLRPPLLEWLATAADPDATLTQLVRFVEAYGMRSLLFELLVANPRLLELVVKTFDASRFAGDLLIRRPHLLEDITRSGEFDRTVTAAEHRKALAATPAAAGQFDPVRAYRQGQALRIIVRDVLGLADVEALQAEHSALAEACLAQVHGIVAGQTDLTVIALGKFGGAELSYGADLDVIFVGENTRAAQELMVEMGKATAEGSIYPLDARLRPDGEKGPLVSPLGAFAWYYETRAQFWEIQALTRARPICGPQTAEFLELAQRVWREAGTRRDLFAQIDAMRARIRVARSTGADILDYKTGLGGVIEAEFLVQAMQMRAGLWNAQFTSALEQLAAAGLMGTADAGALRQSYEFLRGCESVLRRRENKSVSALPAAESEQRALAHWIGSANLDAFGNEYRAARETIHAVYTRYMG